MRNIFFIGWQDVRSILDEEMVKKGITFRYNQVVESIEKTDEGLLATFSNGDQQTFDLVMSAIGRSPKIQGLGLESAGVPGESVDRRAWFSDSR